MSDLDEKLAPRETTSGTKARAYFHAHLEPRGSVVVTKGTLARPEEVTTRAMARSLFWVAVVYDKDRKDTLMELHHEEEGSK